MSTRRLWTRCNGRITSPTFELVLYVFLGLCSVIFLPGSISVRNRTRHGGDVCNAVRVRQVGPECGEDNGGAPTPPTRAPRTDNVG